MPLHVWLPEAHPAAPSHVSALMSGVMIKMGDLRAAARAHLPRRRRRRGGAGCWSAPARRRRPRRAVRPGAARPQAAARLPQRREHRHHRARPRPRPGRRSPPAAPAWRSSASPGALLHVLNHALFKGLLFLGAGAVLHADRHPGPRPPRRPAHAACRVTGATFLVGAAAISGLPPLNGFVSELLLYLGAFGHATGAGPALAVPALTAVVALALIGGLAAACFAKAFGIVFLGEPRAEDAARRARAGRAMRRRWWCWPRPARRSGSRRRRCWRWSCARCSQLGGGARRAAARRADGGRAARPRRRAARGGRGWRCSSRALALLRRRLLRGREVREARDVGLRLRARRRRACSTPPRRSPSR